MNEDIDLFQTGKPRSIWFDLHGLLKAWTKPAAAKARPKRKAPFSARTIAAAAMLGFAATTHAISEPVQLSLAWPIEASAASTKHALLQSLKSIRRMKADWDGRGAPAPVERSISVAEFILPQLPDVVADARAGLDADGHVYLRLNRGSKVAYITVEPKAMHLLYTEPGHPNVYIDDEQFNGRVIPASIRKVLDERLKS